MKEDSAKIVGTCAKCQKEIPKPPEGHIGGVGYSTLPNGGLLCYSCCADMDREWMNGHGNIVLYLVASNKAVINWPGTLCFAVDRFSKGKHNISKTRTDVWFCDAKGNEWWGVNYGNRSTLVHCKRIKA